MLRATIRLVLEGAGHQIAVAVDGADGLRQGQRSDFALVLCDIFMPNKDGIATLTELRRTDASVPVIMMSAGRRVGCAPATPTTWTICNWRRGSARRGRWRNRSMPGSCGRSSTRSWPSRDRDPCIEPVRCGCAGNLQIAEALT
jgi:hypothetical protein